VIKAIARRECSEKATRGQMVPAAIGPAARPLITLQSAGSGGALKPSLADITSEMVLRSEWPARKVTLLARVSPQAHARAKAAAARRGETMAAFVERAIQQDAGIAPGVALARLLREVRRKLAQSTSRGRRPRRALCERWDG
jgi:hypothetical protein